MLTQRVRDLRFDDSLVFSGVLEDIAAADIRRHDDDGVPKVDRPSLRVGKSPIIEDLQQDVEHIRVCLLDLVEQDDGIGTATNSLGELPSFLEADIAWRRANQPGDSVLLHVLGHVDAHHRLLVVEEEFCERTRRLGFADTGRAEENERPNRPIWILQSGA